MKSGPEERNPRTSEIMVSEHERFCRSEDGGKSDASAPRKALRQVKALQFAEKFGFGWRNAFSVAIKPIPFCVGFSP